MFLILFRLRYRQWRHLSVLIATLLSPAAFAADSNTLSVTINDFESLTLPAPESDDDNLTLSFNVDGQSLELQLQPNFKLLASLPVLQRLALNASGDRFYQGQLINNGAINNEPGAENSTWVRLSWVDHAWQGGFFDGEQLYLVDQSATLLDALPYAPDSATIVFKASDLLLPWPVDNGGIFTPITTRSATSLLQALPQQTNNQTSSLARGTLEQLLLTIVTDTQFNGIHGGNTASVVMSRVNFVDGLYTNQVGVSLAVGHLEQLGSNGPLTTLDAEDLLFDFQDFIISGPGSNIPQNGVTHLFTGRNLNGTTVGIAFLGVLCSNAFGFGVDQNVGSATTSSLIFAHELGHNFDAPHDGEDECVNEPFNGIMNPSINGSQTFSNCSLQQMAPEVASANCLISVEETILESGFEG